MSFKAPLIQWPSIAKGISVKYARIDKELPAFKAPVYDNGDAGYDLYARKDMWILPFVVRKIPANLCLEMPKGFFARVTGRSGQSIKGKITVPGTIDASYRGEIHVMMFSLLPKKIKRGDRIAQVILMPCMVDNDMQEVEKDELSTTERGDKGFNSTGTR